MRRLTIGGVVVLVVLGGAHTLAWRWASGQVANQVRVWATAQRAQGWTVELGPMTRAGWPLAAMVHVDRLALASPVSPAAPIASTYSADAAEIGISALQPHLLEIRPLGQQHLHAVPGPDIAFTVDTAMLTLPLIAGAPPTEMNLVADGLRTSIPTAADGSAPGPLVVQHLRLHARELAQVVNPTDNAAPLEMTLQAGPIDLPPALPLAAIGPQITRLAVDTSVSHPVPDVAAWRNAGGSLTLRQLALEWGRFSLTGTASLTLDPALQPSGTGSAKLIGTAETLDALTSARLLAPRAATAMKAVLALLSRPQNNGPPVVEVPLTLQDRTLRVGSFPIVHLPVIAW